jgi:hypothetical protein
VYVADVFFRRRGSRKKRRERGIKKQAAAGHTVFNELSPGDGRRADGHHPHHCRFSGFSSIAHFLMEPQRKTFTFFIASCLNCNQKLNKLSVKNFSEQDKEEKEFCF